MKKNVGYLILLSSLLGLQGMAQDVNSIINKAETERIEKYLSSDELEGRRTFSKGIDKAAEFIANEFKQAGLTKLNNSYLQSFSKMSSKFVSASGSFDGVALDAKNVIVVTPQPTVTINESSGYEVVKINKEDNFGQAARKFLSANNNYIVLVDESFANNFSRLVQLKSNITADQKTVVFVLTNITPTKFKLEATHTIENLALANVVGMIPGKSLSNEYVIFSGHYDHLGINGARAINGDSIYNGANDDAAGTTAMIMLSKYFKKLNNNERTLIFVAFTAEEVGGFGAQYFSKQFDPLTVKAMFNLEMIGTESKWGKNSAYITGYEKTNMGDILQKNFCKKLEEEMINNNNVVIEGLYVDNNSRKELKNLASKYDYNTTYILVKTSYELAYHLNLFRSLYQNKNRVPEIVYMKYKKNFEYPIESDWNEIIEYHPHISKKINQYFLY